MWPHQIPLFPVVVKSHCSMSNIGDSRACCTPFRSTRRRTVIAPPASRNESMENVGSARIVSGSSPSTSCKHRKTQVGWIEYLASFLYTTPEERLQDDRLYKEDFASNTFHSNERETVVTLHSSPQLKKESAKNGLPQCEGNGTVTPAAGELDPSVHLPPCRPAHDRNGRKVAKSSRRRSGHYYSANNAINKHHDESQQIMLREMSHAIPESSFGNGKEVDDCAYCGDYASVNCCEYCQGSQNKQNGLADPRHDKSGSSVRVAGDHLATTGNTAAVGTVDNLLLASTTTEAVSNSNNSSSIGSRVAAQQRHDSTSNSSVSRVDSDQKYASSSSSMSDSSSADYRHSNNTAQHRHFSNNSSIDTPGPGVEPQRLLPNQITIATVDLPSPVFSPMPSDSTEFSSSLSWPEVRFLAGPESPRPQVKVETMTKHDVQQWMQDNKFSQASCRCFEDFTGLDLLAMAKKDMQHLLGASEGLRLYLRLHRSKRKGVWSPATALSPGVSENDS
eukprot:g76853.t1